VAEAPVSPLLEALAKRVLGLLPERHAFDWAQTSAALWRTQPWLQQLVPAQSSPVPLTLVDLLNIDDQKAQIVRNTEQFLAGLPANNVLLWGARGTGKSSLVHALLHTYADRGLRLIEIGKDHLQSLPEIVDQVADVPYRFVLFCDDLSFEVEDPSYKALKSALEGSIFKTTDNVLIYATSNRRHLVPEFMSDNQATRVHGNELHEGEVVEEKISLSDRFGLWLSFYPFKQDDYLQVVDHWVARLSQAHELEGPIPTVATDDSLRAEALRWALARGVRNGRSAQYFARHWVGSRGLES